MNADQPCDLRVAGVEAAQGFGKCPQLVGMRHRRWLRVQRVAVDECADLVVRHQMQARRIPPVAHRSVPHGYEETGRQVVERLRGGERDRRIGNDDPESTGNHVGDNVLGPVACTGLPSGPDQSWAQVVADHRKLQDGIALPDERDAQIIGERGVLRRRRSAPYPASGE